MTQSTTHLVVLYLVLAAATTTVAGAEPPGITGETKYKPYTLVRLAAVRVDPKAALLWRVYPSQSVQRATTPKTLLEFVAPPGIYEVELLAITAGADGALDLNEVRVTVSIDTSSPPPSPLPPAPKTNPEQALGRLRFGSAGCTATVIGPRRPDGRWDILTAAHCTGNAGSKGTLTLKDGRTLAVTVANRNATSDVTWLVTDAVVENLPFALLAEEDPKAGVKVWHSGYGVDRPGNREEGVVEGGPTSQGQLQMTLSVSSGDSGGGIFRSDTNEVISTVCCTTQRGAKVLMFGGTTSVIRSMRPGSTSEEWTPLPIPMCPRQPRTGSPGTGRPTK